MMKTMSNDNDVSWTMDQLSVEILQIKTWVVRIAESLEKIAEKVTAIEDKLRQ